MNTKVTCLYVVLAFKQPGPRWHRVCEPVQWHEAVRKVSREWLFGNPARVEPYLEDEKPGVA